VSYNIDTWKTKKLIDLKIPLSAFYKHPRADWHPEIKKKDGKTFVLVCGCDQEILGEVEDGILSVVVVNMAGEGSGTFYKWILEPALSESTGELEAVLVWEGGDSISRLTVKDGKVENKEIDL
jgi:hypothetical protein